MNEWSASWRWRSFSSSALLLSPSYLRIEEVWFIALLFLLIRPVAVIVGLLGHRDRSHGARPDLVVRHSRHRFPLLSDVRRESRLERRSGVAAHFHHTHRHRGLHHRPRNHRHAAHGLVSTTTTPTHQSRVRFIPGSSDAKLRVRFRTRPLEIPFPCLCTFELQSLAAWLRDVPVGGQLNFTEPNLRFEHVERSDGDVLLVAFSQESSPPWATEGERYGEGYALSFPFSLNDFAAASAALQNMLLKWPIRTRKTEAG